MFLALWKTLKIFFRWSVGKSFFFQPAKWERKFFLILNIFFSRYFLPERGERFTVMIIINFLTQPPPPPSYFDQLAISTALMSHDQHFLLIFFNSFSRAHLNWWSWTQKILSFKRISCLRIANIFIEILWFKIHAINENFMCISVISNVTKKWD
jgi:hypothetical protein